jgi:hypothetical protein
VPIPGTKRRNYLEENIAAGEIPLTPQDISRLDAIVPMGVAAGARYQYTYSYGDSPQPGAA